MRKKSGLTIVEQAIVLVPEFEKLVRKLDQQVALRGQSKSTLDNYIRRIALFRRQDILWTDSGKTSDIRGSTSIRFTS